MSTGTIVQELRELYKFMLIELCSGEKTQNQLYVALRPKYRGHLNPGRIGLSARVLRSMGFVQMSDDYVKLEKGVREQLKGLIDCIED